MFQKSFCRSHIPHKSVILTFRLLNDFQSLAVDPVLYARPFVGVFQKSIYKRTCQLLATNAHKMAPRTTRRHQERQGDAPTKGLAWALPDAVPCRALRGWFCFIARPAQISYAPTNLIPTNRYMAPRTHQLLQDRTCKYLRGLFVVYIII